jgi:hypothetical protein
MYCNCCGAKMHIALPRAVGRDYKCCSMGCYQEMKWRETLSIIGKEYYLDTSNVEYLRNRYNRLCIRKDLSEEELEELVKVENILNTYR